MCLRSSGLCVPLRSLPPHTYSTRTCTPYRHLVHHLCELPFSGRDLKERYLNTRRIDDRVGTRLSSISCLRGPVARAAPALRSQRPGPRAAQTPYSSASLPRRARRFRFLNALASGVALACIAATCAGHFLSRQSCAAESSTPPSWYLEGKGGRDRPLGSWPLEPVRFAPPGRLG